MPTNKPDYTGNITINHKHGVISDELGEAIADCFTAALDEVTTEAVEIRWLGEPGKFQITVWR